jgi:NADH dehydrogenase
MWQLPVWIGQPAPFRDLGAGGRVRQHLRQTRADLALIYPIIGDGQAKFQPVWVEDLVTSVVKSLDDSSTIHQDLEIGGPEVLTIAEIERRTLQAIGAKRQLIQLPIPLLRGVVAVMGLLPAPPVTSSLLDLLAVDNTTRNNAIGRFVAQPQPFTAENAAPYMRQFKLGDTLRQFLGKPISTPR